MRNKILLVLAAVAASLGCSNGSNNGLSISATGSTAAADTNTVASGNVIDAGHGILITRIRVVIASAEVEGSPACANVVAPPVINPTVPAPGSPPAAPSRPGVQPVATGVGMACVEGSEDLSDDDDGECEIAGGPYLVDLAGADLTGGTQFVVGLDVPAGTYDEVEFKIRTINATRAGTSEGLKAMAAAHASMLVDGTMDRVGFTFSTPMALKQERQGPIVVDPKTGAHVTLDFDASAWFEAADGGKLDPTDPTDRGQILANIRGSIRVVSDDDHDGREDGHHHGDHHDGAHDKPWAPCDGKACGARCQLCAPGDGKCVETAVLKVCDPAGACVAEGTPFTCPALPAACKGLTCGSECTISLPCHLATSPCLAPQWLGHCDLSGQCLPGDAGACRPSADCAGKACGDTCNPCGPDKACPTFVATACDPWGRCVAALPGLCACVGKDCGASCDPCGGLCSHPYASTCDGTGHCRPVGRGVTCGP